MCARSMSHKRIRPGARRQPFELWTSAVSSNLASCCRKGHECCTCSHDRGSRCAVISMVLLVLGATAFRRFVVSCVPSSLTILQPPAETCPQNPHTLTACARVDRPWTIDVARWSFDLGRFCLPLVPSALAAAGAHCEHHPRDNNLLFCLGRARDDARSSRGSRRFMDVRGSPFTVLLLYYRVPAARQHPDEHPYTESRPHTSAAFSHKRYTPEENSCRKDLKGWCASRQFVSPLYSNRRGQRWPSTPRNNTRIGEGIWAADTGASAGKATHNTWA